MRNLPRRFCFFLTSAIGLTVAVSSAAHAEDTSVREQRLDRRGDRIDERIDRRADRVGGDHTPAR